MSIIIPANTLAAAGGFSVDNSCRFNDGDSADLRISDYSGAGTSRKTRTYSMWIKRSELSYAVIFGSAGKDHWVFTADHKIQINIGSGTDSRRITDMVFRDVSAWYHIVFAYDTTQGTAANRFTMWVNGAVATTSIVAGKNEVAEDEEALVFINGDTSTIGSDEDSASYFDGYMAEWVFVDGQKLDADSFGEYDEDSGIWKPIDVSGITLGTNGFYLDFKTASDLGIDAGNDNDFEPTNLAATDQSLDTCTNNQCVLNGILLPNSEPATFSQGNTAIVQNGNWRSYAGTFGLTSGKWYFEADGSGTAGTVLYGIASLEAINLQDKTASNLNYTIGLNQPAYAYHGSSGGMYHSTSSANAQGQGGGSWGAAFNSSNLISVYIDLDNNKLYTAKDNTMNVSGTGYDIEAGFTYFPVVVAYSVTTALNFGNGEFNGTAVSSAVADANGFGAFEYDPSRGGGSDFDGAAKDFLAICTKNLAEYG
jgi:hypothetical protein